MSFLSSFFKKISFFFEFLLNLMLTQSLLFHLHHDLVFQPIKIFEKKREKLLTLCVLCHNFTLRKIKKEQCNDT